MKKVIRNVGICLCVAILVWIWGLLSDRQKLRDDIIRLHVVANSDSEHDQAIKLQVRNAVVESLEEAMKEAGDMDAARVYLESNLPEITNLVNRVLESCAVEGNAVVTLTKEAFDTRHYDTFSLPAGVYESLRIVIGQGEGKNWWCVVFPSLCIPATSSGFADVAVGAGFEESLTSALSGEEGYEIRFYLLDRLGELENMLFQG